MGFNSGFKGLTISTMKMWG